MSQSIVCLMGPTGSGKTSLAVDLVRSHPYEIISVDSAMVYRGMDIGTAKPDAATLSAAPHHLIDMLDPVEAYSAGQFCRDASQAIDLILKKGKLPLLVGGTMMYFRALQFGMATLPKADVGMRDAFKHQLENQGLASLYAQLLELDPVAAGTINSNDSQRIQRALEVYQLSGKSITEWQKENVQPLAGVKFINIALAPSDRAILHQRIQMRFDLMLEQGLIEEVKKLHHRGDLSIQLPSLRSVGYRQVWQYLNDELTFDEMREAAIVATRQLAKRQLTWLRSWPDVVWFDSEAEDLSAKVKNFLGTSSRG